MNLPSNPEMVVVGANAEPWAVVSAEDIVIAIMLWEPTDAWVLPDGQRVVPAGTLAVGDLVEPQAQS